ncbi:MAG: glycosyltransferase family 2 protein [Planctomycetaceae bacterium]
MTAPRIAVATVFLPRMELEYLGDWIAYHRNLGITHFYLYNNGHVSHDAKFNQTAANQTWQKRPEADYHTELSDEEVDQQVSSILADSGPYVFHISWPGGSEGHGGFYVAQMRAVNSLLKQLQSSQEADWLAFIDIDELLVPAQDSLSTILNGVDSDCAALLLSQKLFESRWQGGRGVPYSRITRSFGVLDFNHKLIARVSHCRRWENPHSIQVNQGRVTKFPASRLRFHHFRGNEHFGKAAPPGWGVHRYIMLEGTIEDDSSHLEFLPHHQ